MAITLTYLFLLLLGAFLVTFMLMPRIIGVVKHKSLMVNPNIRSSHLNLVPSLGGIAFYIVIVLGIYFLVPWDIKNISMSFMPGLLILFIIGLKDDLVVLSPVTKIIAQILAMSFILMNPNFHITALHGFLGMEHISLFVSLPLAGFIMLSIINAFNLIDGIDGLASIVGMVIFTILGILFFTLGMFYFAGISALMIGSLAAFLRFNLSSGKKIFMGDTGSMLIGFVIGTSVIRLFAVEPLLLKKLPFQMENLPLVVMAILIVPFFDTARVFTIRIMNKKGPFSPDRNHIHHLLIDYLKLSHRRASFFIGLFNLLFICIFVFLSANFDNLIMLGLMIVCLIGFVYLFYRINFSYKNLRRRLKFRARIFRLKEKFIIW